MERTSTSKQIAGDADEAELAAALKQHEFEPWFQPKVDLRSGRVSGAEVLVRWCRLNADPLPPDRFLNVIRERGMMRSLTLAVAARSAAVLAAGRRAREGLHAVAQRVPVAARRPGVRAALARALIGAGATPAGSGARDHRKRRGSQSRRGAREPRASAHARLRSLDRRLRHGLLVAREARAHAVLGAQDRSRVREPSSSTILRRARWSNPSSRSLGGSGCAPWPKESRRKRSTRSCSASIATWVRATVRETNAGGRVAAVDAGQARSTRRGGRGLSAAAEATRAIASQGRADQSAAESDSNRSS